MSFENALLIFLGVIWGASLTYRGRSLLEEKAGPIFFIGAALLFAYLTYLSFLQYRAMLRDPFASLLLPPHQGVGYFILSVAGARIFAPYLLSLSVALLFLWAAARYNRRHGGQFFEEGEVYIGALSLLLVGHPGWIVYFITLVLLYTLVQLYVHFVRGKAGERVPLYYLWVPTAIFAILINEYWLYETGFWKLLKI